MDHGEERREYYKVYYAVHRKELLAYGKANKKAHREERLAYYKAYRIAHREDKRAYNAAHRKETNARVAIYHRNKKLADVNYRIKCRLRNRLWKVLRGNYKTGSAVRDLGCSIEHFKKHLEAQFQPGMTWENYGNGGWHLDHIRPLVLFDLTDRSQFLEAAHYTNLQPLWAKDNLSKGATPGETVKQLSILEVELT